MWSKEAIGDRFRNLQLFITKELERVDGLASFEEDAWDREEGGGGFTRTISNGAVIEKGGVAFSAVHGPVSDVMRRQLNLDGNSFYATGVSIVLHPKNPHVPIIHMNVRYFELDNGTCWFGGGIDLTPHYIVDRQAVQFHERLKAICDRFNVTFYDRFKPWADDYFFLPHRNESRGIGGIFYDHIQPDEENSKEKMMDFALALGEAFPFIYEEQAIQGKDLSFTEQELKWRNLRRGRYVEFNLVHDRGTKFGLFSGGRTESILMSLPPDASWEYGFQADQNSKEAETLDKLGQRIDWLH